MNDNSISLTVVSRLDLLVHSDIFVKTLYSDMVNLGCNCSPESIKISLHLEGIVLAFDKSSVCLSLKLLVILVTYLHRRGTYFQLNIY